MWKLIKRLLKRFLTARDDVCQLDFLESQKMKHYKYDKIRQYAKSGKSNVSLLSDKQKTLFLYAAKKGFLTEKNDAPRNGKVGLHYEVLRYFDDDRLAMAMYADRRRAERDARRRQDVLKKACAEVLPVDCIDYFCTSSGVGAIKIDGAYYTNFYGNGDNRVEVCSVDFDAFKKADKITRRQVYNVKEPISVVKFDAPKTINVSLSDVDDSADVKTIGNVCGFAIWSRKAKIFVAKNDNGQA